MWLWIALVYSACLALTIFGMSHKKKEMDMPHPKKSPKIADIDLVDMAVKVQECIDQYCLPSSYGILKMRSNGSGIRVIIDIYGDDGKVIGNSITYMGFEHQDWNRPVSNLKTYLNVLSDIRDGKGFSYLSYVPGISVAKQ